MSIEASVHLDNDTIYLQRCINGKSSCIQASAIPARLKHEIADVTLINDVCHGRGLLLRDLSRSEKGEEHSC